jgi:hypothetical protein
MLVVCKFSILTKPSFTKLSNHTQKEKERKKKKEKGKKKQNLSSSSPGMVLH